MEAAPGLEPGVQGFAGLCLTNLAMPPREYKFYRRSGEVSMNRAPLTPAMRIILLILSIHVVA